MGGEEKNRFKFILGADKSSSQFVKVEDTHKFLRALAKKKKG